jgi:hypothetical protein
MRFDHLPIVSEEVVDTVTRDVLQYYTNNDTNYDADFVSNLIENNPALASVLRDFVEMYDESLPEPYHDEAYRLGMGVLYIFMKSIDTQLEVNKMES